MQEKLKKMQDAHVYMLAQWNAKTRSSYKKEHPGYSAINNTIK